MGNKVFTVAIIGAGSRGADIYGRLLMQLPEKFKTVLLLHYVEEYKVEEIARIIGKTPSAVKMRLQKGRKLLEEKYRKEFL